MTESPLQTQIGGDHYKNFAIQPIEFIFKNDIGFIEGCVIKRMCRYKYKGTPIEDLEKAKHEIEFLIEFHNEEKEG